METKTCLAAILLLAVTFLPYLLSQRPAAPAFSCTDEERHERIDPFLLRGALPVVSCSDGTAAGAREPRGAPGVLLGRRIDLNDATVEELAALPEIGPGRARRIAAERERGGPFADVTALRRVHGMGTKRIRSLAPWARAGPATRGADAAAR